ncbi:hypothetical protein ACVWXO_005702 [Bradyrhizobium sp. LM2.7]
MPPVMMTHSHAEAHNRKRGEVARDVRYVVGCAEARLQPGHENHQSQERSCDPECLIGHQALEGRLLANADDITDCGVCFFYHFGRTRLHGSPP